MEGGLRHYVSDEEDSARWHGFPLRQGDIVVSTRSKHGTTWTQTILLLLIHETPELPATLAELSPWLDHVVESRQAVIERLTAQRHRRIIKTHTPLDGIPFRSDITYVVTARHPLDAAVSLYHQGDNIDRQVLHRLTGREPIESAARPPLPRWLAAWIDRDVEPNMALDSLPGVMHHLSDAWARRHESNVVLVHYDDLLDDLDGEMRRLAHATGLRSDQTSWTKLVEAATFRQMRARADRLVPDPAGLLHDPAAFFRRGTSGAATELLDAATRARYDARAATLAPPDLLRWLHRHR